MTKRPPTPDILADLLGAPGERVQDIALAVLDPNPYQHRSNAIADDDPAMLELVASVQANGILQPLIVRIHPAQPARYQIGAGHRRLSAAHLAGLDSAPCIVRPLSDDDMLDVVVTENYHRSDVNPIDRAQLFQVLVDRGLTHAQIAERFAISRPTVSNALRLLQLPPTIQAEVVAGAISNRQAEAILPLASLPQVALDNPLASYATTLSDLVRTAKNGTNSDRLRDMAASAVREHTKEIPEHWGNMVFDAPEIAGSLRSPCCTDCPIAVQTSQGKRCPDRACWDSKSSHWNGIEHRKAVAQAGVPIVPEGAHYSDQTHIYSRERALLNLPEPPNPPPAPVCANLRLKLNSYNKTWDWVCHRPGKKQCQCIAQASRAMTKAGAGVWKDVRAQTTETLAAALSAWPLETLRVLAYTYDGAYDPKGCKHRTMTAEEILPNLVEKLVHRAEPGEPAKWPDAARDSMTALLSLAGVRAPWLPPLTEEIAEQMRTVDAFVAEYVDPGDGLPTPESVAGMFRTLDQILRSIHRLPPEDAPGLWSRQHTDLTARLAALSDRVEANHRDTPEEA